MCIRDRQGTLHLTDVGLAQQQHGHPGLADAAPHGQGQLTVEQHPVEGEGAAAVTACQGELAVQGLWADPDAHGGEFNSLAIDAVPEQKDVYKRQPYALHFMEYLGSALAWRYSFKRRIRLQM